MLNESVRVQAGMAIESRFQLRDETLDRELEDLAARCGRDPTGEEKERLGVRLRLICERDLFDRASIACASLCKTYQELGGVRRDGLLRDLIRELEGHMRGATLNLAGKLRHHSDELGPAFQGAGAINAEWLASLRQRATERQSQNIETYVGGLRRGMPFVTR